MTGKTQAEVLAAYAVRASYDMLSALAREQLAIRVLDSLGCALAAVGGEPMRHVRAQIDDFGCPGPCVLIGGGTAAPDRAALYNTALVRYLDFMAQGETYHPGDNVGSLLAAADYAGGSGRGLPQPPRHLGGRRRQVRPPRCRLRGRALRREISGAVRALDTIPIAGLTRPLRQATRAKR